MPHTLLTLKIFYLLQVNLTFTMHKLNPIYFPLLLDFKL